MKVLGIDPGFARMGYAIVEESNRKQVLIHADCIETSPGVKHEKRLFAIGEELKQIILKHKPEIVVIEKIFFAKNQKNAIKVAQAQGMLFYIAAAHNLPIHEFTPLEIKMSLCGYGRADKNQVRKMLKIILGIDELPKLDDASDAIAAALTYLSRTYPHMQK